MSDDTNRKLAEWMGWQSGKFYGPPLEGAKLAWFEKNGKFIMFDDDWHPDTNIAQAMRCLEKIRQQGYCYNAWDTDAYHHIRLTNVYGKMGEAFTGHGTTFEAAIYAAILKAVEGSGEVWNSNSLKGESYGKEI